MTRQDPTIELCMELIRRRSITPEDAGCQALMGQRLAQCGFDLEPMPFGEVNNLWAQRGDEGPLLVFAGHTDVVPPGPREAWDSDPFEPEIRDGVLYGRGAADMKGSLAAMVTAVEAFVAEQPQHKGRIGFLITSDEEGPATDGTVRVVDLLRGRDEFIDWCIVGEPSSSEALGDVVKNGRRGSISAEVIIEGLQGHVAYPQLAKNPIHQMAPIMAELVAIEWDQGDEHFPPTSLQVTKTHSAEGAENVIPGEAGFHFNLRYSPAQTAEGIQARVIELLDSHQVDYRIRWRHSGAPFITQPGKLLNAINESILEVTGIETRLSTAGGTSDGRFIAPLG
ncbi:MAG: succinyl-diaminopimelate desuccinylase, partial [Salinisphaeraceae bacterium]|nr:succinyl-diaminopimelate desuccinylase [Salinisphaeraceae bacterium]